MTRDEITAKLQQQGIEIVSLCKQLEAAHKAFSAACFAGNGAMSDEARQRIIVLTEAQLDCVAISMTLSRALMEQG